MGLALWYFVRPAPGELLPVARAQVDAFFNGETALPNAQGLLQYVEVVVRVEGRKAREVVRFGGFQYRVDADGALDREHLGEVMALAGEATFGSVLAGKPVPGVIAAGHRFAQRRLEHVSRWTPSGGELALLRALVNLKAGRTIM